MSRENDGARELRAETKKEGFTYAESDESDAASPNGSPGSSYADKVATGGSKTSIDITGSDSEDQDDNAAAESDDDVIQGLSASPM